MDELFQTRLSSQLQIVETDARMHTIRKVLSMTKWFTSEELMQRIINGSETGEATIRNWLASREIFSVIHNEQMLFARYQFDSHDRPLPIINLILDILKIDDPWAIAAWFVCENSWVKKTAESCHCSPVDILDRHEELMCAARHERATHFS
ncbi:hypothetical protein [Pseudoduganella umbonata]|uniref:DUF2384 domain-containing protein n=1 Tax=Pseudoduganella umbonata TaxID=864828 RepID=A0A4P8HNL3_9BURK|nr:hypothetical protein [Pseudoduganella umbonata]MBB3219996.1 hypothetical protein [Pseudoduganella umbonata]QCP10004.1 hypothetical protein FCL38_05890 [Pseudoduganella umbonata]